MSAKVILAYSGGLDTSVAIRWLRERNMDVVAACVDVGNEKDFSVIKQKALDVGAVKSIVIDAKEPLVNYFLFPALKANALYEGVYPLATALTRPLIAKLLVDLANEEGAKAIAHGCTGKGNDQVRIEVGIRTLDPDIEIIAPAREWGWTREETINYAKQYGIPVPVTVASPYSIDECLWGRAVECGVLEDPWNEPPDEAFTWTKSEADSLEAPGYVEIGFEKGVPLSLNGKKVDGITLINLLNEFAGSHGVGRIDHIEDRLVGIKSREVYEAPAAVLLIQAHKALESLVLSRAQVSFKRKVDDEYADLVYDGLWFSGLHHDLTAYVESSQEFVTGTVRIKLHKGSSIVVGRKSAHSLYNLGLATYDKGDTYDPSSASGFIKLWGLSAQNQAQAQGIGSIEDEI